MEINDIQLVYCVIKHLSTKHPNDKDKPIEYFQEIHKIFPNRSTIVATFKKQHAANENVLIASYHILHLIVKSGKSHNIEEIVIIPSIKEFISTVVHEDIPGILKTFPLSDSTVNRKLKKWQLMLKKTYKYSPKLFTFHTIGRVYNCR